MPCVVRLYVSLRVLHLRVEVQGCAKRQVERLCLHNGQHGLHPGMSQRNSENLTQKFQVNLTSCRLYGGQKYRLFVYLEELINATVTPCTM